MCDRNSDPTTYDEAHAKDMEMMADKYGWDGPEDPENMDQFWTANEAQDYHAHQEAVTAFVSPFVQRNLDCAQYQKPRGSQYEG